MDYKEFFAQVKAGGLRGAYLFEGTEEYVKASALAAVEKALLHPGMEQLNEAVLENPAADALIAAAETLPFLADKRLVVARELSAFTGRGEGDDRLGEYLARIPESCVLILYVQGKADARKKLYQAVKKHGTVVSFQPMDEAELNRWLVRTAKGMGKEQYLVPYLMSSHPGSTLQAAVELAVFLKQQHIHPEQVQDFYPTPGTLSTCMFYTELDPYTMEPVYVPKTPEEKAMQRALLQYFQPRNKALVLAALKKAGRRDLIGTGPDCLVAPEEPARRIPAADRTRSRKDGQKWRKGKGTDRRGKR